MNGGCVGELQEAKVNSVHAWAGRALLVNLSIKTFHPVTYHHYSMCSQEAAVFDHRGRKPCDSLRTSL